MRPKKTRSMDINLVKNRIGMIYNLEKKILNIL